MVTSCVVTVSDRVSAGEAEDRTGPEIVAWLEQLGHRVERRVVPDGDQVAAAIRQAAAGGAGLVLTTGGTGISPRDLTPQAVQPLLRVEIPGIMEQIRQRGAAAGVAGAALTRGVAGLVDGPDGPVVVVTLPGSMGGVRDGLAVLQPLLAHLLEQAKGADHPHRG